MVVTYKDDISTFDPAIGYDWQNWSMIKKACSTGSWTTSPALPS